MNRNVKIFSQWRYGRGLPDMPPDPLSPVFRIECDRPPSLYQCGGLRIPRVPHPPYDPCPSDIKH